VLVNSEEMLRLLFLIFIGVAILIAVSGIFQSLIYDPYQLDIYPANIFTFKIPRATSVWGTPLSLAGYLGLVLALWHPLKDNLYDLFQGWIGHLITFVFWFCLVLTFTRSAMIAIVIAFVLARMFLSMNWSNIFWGLIALVVSIPLLLNLLTWVRMPNAVGKYGLLPYDTRLKHWESLLSKFLQRPLVQVLFGRGLGANSGSMPLDLFQVFGSKLEKTGQIVTDNFYLTILFEIGSIGLLIFAIMCITYLFMGIRLHQKTKKTFFKQVYKGVIIGMIFFLIRNLFLQGMRTLLAGFYFWTLVGIMFAVNQIDRSPAVKRDLS
jgi:hypothetical protein